MFGGGQRVALDLVESVRRHQDLDARLVLLGCSEAALEHAADAIVPYNGAYNRAGVLFATANRLRQVLARMEPDIVHSHGWDADIIGWLATKGNSTRQLIHLHVTPAWINSGAVRHRLRRALTRSMFQNPRAGIVAVSNAVKQHWGGVFAAASEKTQVVHNGVDSQSFRPDHTALEADDRHDEPLILGTACRLAPQKGLKHLLDALPQVLNRTSRPVRLCIAGQGTLLGELEAQAVALGLTEHVRFLGPVTDMPAFYRSLDIFVLPAVSDEGLPLAVLEAMASGLPVVATDVGGTKEAVRHGREGLVVAPRNAEALTAALVQLVDDKKMREELGRQARRRVCDTFSLAAQTEGIIGLYQSMLETRVHARQTASLPTL